MLTCQKNIITTSSFISCFYIVFMVVYFCHHLSDNYVDLSIIMSTCQIFFFCYLYGMKRARLFLKQMNKWQVNIKIWQDNLKIWQVNIIIWKKICHMGAYFCHLCQIIICWLVRSLCRLFRSLWWYRKNFVMRQLCGLVICYVNLSDIDVDLSDLDVDTSDTLVVICMA